MSRVYEDKGLSSMAAPFKVYIYKNSGWTYVYLVGKNSKGFDINLSRNMFTHTDTGMRKLLGSMIEEMKKEAEEL